MHHHAVKRPLLGRLLPVSEVVAKAALSLIARTGGHVGFVGSGSGMDVLVGVDGAAFLQDPSCEDVQKFDKR
jgi:predicted alpha/beta-fold hydrolase